MEPILIKRIYDPANNNDGYRILVDRLWPRGISKEKALLDEWMKDIAPSPALRKWFDHQEKRFATFRSDYQMELLTDPIKNELLHQILEKAATKNVTLLYAAKDPHINHAVVLLETLLQQRKS